MATKPRSRHPVDISRVHDLVSEMASFERCPITEMITRIVLDYYARWAEHKRPHLVRMTQPGDGQTA